MSIPTDFELEQMAFEIVCTFTKKDRVLAALKHVRDRTLSSLPTPPLPNPESQKDDDAASNGLPERGPDLRAQVEALIVERDSLSAEAIRLRYGRQLDAEFCLKRITELEVERDQARVRMEAAERECILISDIAKDWRSTSGTPISDVVTTSQFVDLLAKAAHMQKARIAFLEEALIGGDPGAPKCIWNVGWIRCLLTSYRGLLEAAKELGHEEEDPSAIFEMCFTVEKACDQMDAALSSTTPPQTGSPTDTELLSVLCRANTTLCELHSLEEPDGHDFVLDDGWRDAVAQRSSEIIALYERLRAAMGSPSNPPSSVEAEANRESAPEVSR